MKTSSCAVTCSWLTKSASLRGRSERSSSSSPPSRASAIGSAAIGVVEAAARSSESREMLMPLPWSRRRASAAPISSSGVSPAAPLEQLLGLGQRVAEVHEPVASERARVVVWPGGERRHALLELAGDLLAQLDDHPLGGALADPGHRLEALRVAGGDRAQELARRAAREDRDRDLRADARRPRSGAGTGRAPPRRRSRRAASSRRGRPGGRAASRPCRWPARPSGSRRRP